MKMCILRGVISSMMKILSSTGLEGSLNGLLSMKTITSYSLHTGSQCSLAPVGEFKAFQYYHQNKAPKEGSVPET